MCCSTGRKESFSGVPQEGFICPSSSPWMLIAFHFSAFPLLVEEAVRLLPDISSDWPCLDQRFVPAPSAMAREMGHVWGIRITDQ